MFKMLGSMLSGVLLARASPLQLQLSTTSLRLLHCPTLCSCSLLGPLLRPLLSLPAPATVVLNYYGAHTIQNQHNVRQS